MTSTDARRWAGWALTALVWAVSRAGAQSTDTPDAGPEPEAALAAQETPAAPPQRVVHVAVTAIDAGALMVVGDVGVDRPKLLVRRALETYASPDDAPLPVAFGGDSPPDRSRATLRVRESGTVVVTDRVSLAFRWVEGALAGIAVHEPTPDGDPSPVGSRVELYQSLAAPAVTVVSLPGAQLVISSAALVISREEGGIRVLVMSGEAVVFPGALPAGGVSALAGGVTLRAAGENSILVSPELGAAVQAEIPPASERLAAGTVVRESLVQELYSVAETVAEGDIQPPTRGAGIGPSAVAPFARIPEIVPRGTAATQTLAGAQTVVVTTAVSTAESFLAQGNAALAVVGARLERTRIIGNTSGLAAQGPLSISGNLQRPFTIRTSP